MSLILKVVSYHLLVAILSYELLAFPASAIESLLMVCCTKYRYFFCWLLLPVSLFPPSSGLFNFQLPQYPNLDLQVWWTLLEQCETDWLKYDCFQLFQPIRPQIKQFQADFNLRSHPQLQHFHFQIFQERTHMWPIFVRQPLSLFKDVILKLALIPV